MDIGFFYMNMCRFFVYILHSESTGRYYVGETIDIENRLSEHNTHFFPGAFTMRADDWTVFLTIECKNRTQARLIESHIKRMKSKTYILNLKKHPEMIEKLIAKYDIETC